MKLSIIIPAYNDEKYLAQCLDSCLAQDIPSSEYEIIVVNDGSIDGTQAIAESYALKFDNFFVLSQANHGQGSARNAGMKIAKGDYIWFVDSDDWIKENCLSCIIKEIEDNKLDALRLTFSKYEEGIIRYENRPVLTGIVSGIDGFRDLLSFNCVPWLTIFKRGILREHQLEFLKDMYHEDTEFTPRAYYYIKRLMFYDSPVYVYRVSATSVMHVPTLKRSKDLIRAAFGLRDFARSISKSDRAPYYRYMASGAVNPAFDNALKIDEDSKKQFNVFLAEKKDIFGTFLNSPSMMHKVEGLLLLLFPSRSIDVFSIIRSLKK